jgi:hypothetical protein
MRKGSSMKAANKKPVVVQGDHKVGYGRPPVDRRFKPGQSGNPRGTSRKLKHTPYEEQLKGIVTDELYRKIPVRDGDWTARIPIMQAIIRSAAVSAAKGDVRAQRLVAELVRWTEEGRLASKLRGLEDAFDYKEGWSKELARRKRLGIVGEEPVPHPDHIEIDWNRAEIDIIGPMTRKQKKHTTRCEPSKRVARKTSNGFSRNCWRRPTTARCCRTWLT